MSLANALISEVAQVLGDPEDEAQLLDAEICAGEVVAALPDVVDL